MNQTLQESGTRDLRNFLDPPQELRLSDLFPPKRGLAQRAVMRLLGIDADVGYDAARKLWLAQHRIAGGATSKLYIAVNGASPTTAAQVPVTTGTAIKTLLQVATPATTDLKIIEWGISFDGSAAAQPIKVELLQTDVAATVTSLTPTIWGDPNAPASLCVGGTAATGYTATAEGTITAARMFDPQLIAPTSQYVKQYPLGREPQVPVSKFLRIRVTAPAAVNAYCYIIWEE